MASKGAKYTTRSGVTVEAYVVGSTEGERELQARTTKGNELLTEGDALVTVKGKQYALPEALFAALFSEASEKDPDEKPAKDAKEPGKGGQQRSETKG